MGPDLRKITCMLLVVLLLPCLALPAMAEDYSTTLDSLHFDIQLLSDGSALFTETRVLTFRGDHEFTRYGFGNAFSGPRAFTDWAVSIDGVPLKMLSAPDDDRPVNTFAVENGDGNNTVYIYHSSRETTRTFVIRYRVENAVKLFQDVADFHWNLTGQESVSTIGAVTATVTVPQGVADEDFRVWAHGPLNGSIRKTDDTTAQLRVERVASGELVDLRICLPPECFTGGWIQEGAALEGILADEKILADDANARREELAREEAEREAYWEKRYAWQEEHPILTAIEGFCMEISDFFYFNIEDQLFGLTAGAGLCAFVFPALFGRTEANPDKLRRKPVQSPQYQRTLPDLRPAPAVDKLLHTYRGDGSADSSRQISSALLELNLKGLIRLRTAGNDALILLNEEKGAEVFPATPVLDAPARDRSYSFKMYRSGDEVITETHGTPPGSQNPTYLEALWRFLLEVSQGTGQVNVKELKQFVRDNQEKAWNFRCSFDSAVQKEYDQRVRLEWITPPAAPDNKLIFLIPPVTGILSMLIRLFSTFYDGMEFGESLWAGILAFAVSLVLVFLIRLGSQFSPKQCRIMDQQSENDLALWQAFGRFLDDFTTFDRKELPEFPVWREYMVYAVVMGKGQKVAQALEVVYPEAFGSDSAFFDDDYYRYLRDRHLFDSLDSIGQQVTQAQPPRTESASASGGWSDGGGGGGGFSSSGGGSDSGSTGDFSD